MLTTSCRTIPMKLSLQQPFLTKMSGNMPIAMVIAGYDDNKGPMAPCVVSIHGALRWGGDGYFWVDYNFFMNEFVSSLSNETNLYIAANDDSDTRATG
ncbi:MAG: hypothetical protein MZU84_01665 [Sphingobacterium sp.]|nr:hypothetical protein [Sphingobacterium sp.]